MSAIDRGVYIRCITAGQRLFSDSVAVRVCPPRSVFVWQRLRSRCGQGSRGPVRRDEGRAPWRRSRMPWHRTDYPTSRATTATPTARRGPPAPIPPAAKPSAPRTAKSRRSLAGTWHDTTLGRHHLPRLRRDRVAAPQAPRGLAPGPRYISYLDKHFYPFFGHRPLNRITPSPGPGLGHHAQRRRARTAVDPEVPRLPVLGLRPGGQRPGPGPQPVRPHRAPQGHHPQAHRTLTPDEYAPPPRRASPSSTG